MPPSIVITEPVPRWKAWAQILIKALFLVLLCAVSFYAGMNYQHPPSVEAPAPAVEITEDGAPVPVEAAAPAPATASNTDLLAPRSLDGLQIQSLRVARDPAVAGQLLFNFEIMNEGRLFEGSYEFLLLGLQDGKPVQWSFPPSPASGSYRMRVARYVQMGGKIQPPSGLQVQAVILSLQETAGLRASRGQALAEAGSTGQ